MWSLSPYLVVKIVHLVDRTDLFKISNLAYGGRENVTRVYSTLQQCFSTAGPRAGTGPWHQLYRAARNSPGIDN